MSNLTEADKAARLGLAFGFGAFFIWGLLPIYLKQLAALSAFDVLAWRILFSAVFVALILKATGQWRETRRLVAETLSSPRNLLRGPVVSALLISWNWLIFLWAVNADRILETSIGYYLNPLVIVLLGRIVLKEHLSRLQWVAVALAALGLAVMLKGLGTWPWIPLSLAITFGFYALIRKVAPMNGLVALLLEGLLLSPFALLWLAVSPMSVGFGGTFAVGGWPLLALLAGAGVITVTPLALYIGAARRLRFSTVGMIQYLAPTLSFLTGVFLYGEPFTTAHGIMFGCVWAGVVIFVADLLRQRHQRRARPAPAVKKPIPPA